MLFNHPSVHTDRSATLRGQTVIVEGILKELSTGGVVIESAKKASIGTRVEVFFEIPALGLIHKIEAFGFVEHFHNIDTGYLLGIEFKDIPTESQRYIQDFIDYKHRLHELGKKHYRIEN